jgi:hypothetical protein
MEKISQKVPVHFFLHFLTPQDPDPQHKVIESMDAFRIRIYNPVRTCPILESQKQILKNISPAFLNWCRSWGVQPIAGGSGLVPPLHPQRAKETPPGRGPRLEKATRFA